MKAKLVRESLDEHYDENEFNHYNENEFDDSDYDTRNNEIEEPFIAHGFYTVSNAGGYEVQLSDDGDLARIRDAYGSDNPKVSEWFEIEWVPDEDADEEEDADLIAVIDPDGYNIPLNQVMRTNYRK